MIRGLELLESGVPPLIARFIFPVGQTTSTPVLLGGATLLRLRWPSNLTGTSVQMQSSLDGVAWSNVLDPATNSVWSANVIANGDYYVGPSIGAGHYMVRLVSSAAQTGSDAVVIGTVLDW